MAITNEFQAAVRNHPLYQPPSTSAPKASKQTEPATDKSSISAEAQKKLAESRAAARDETKEASSRKAWMPDRLEPLEPFTVLTSIGMANTPVAGIPTTMDPASILSLQNSDNWIVIPQDDEIAPSPEEIKSACPKWYENLADVKNQAQSEDIISEYYEHLKEAMNEALDEANIPTASEPIVNGMHHHQALIDDKEKSESIHQSVKNKLTENPRATELMELLGIS